jgi:hypothetical protein
VLTSSAHVIVMLHSSRKLWIDGPWMMDDGWWIDGWGMNHWLGWIDYGWMNDSYWIYGGLMMYNHGWKVD